MPPKKPSKQKKEAAARVCAGRANIQELSKSGTSEPNPESAREGNPSPEPQARAPAPIFVDSDSEWESGYQGGVNYYVLSEEETDTDNDGEAGCESFDEDEEDIITILKDKAHLYTQIQQTKSAWDWKIAEANRSFRYNGHSSRTVRRQWQEARKRQAFHEEAKTL